MAIYVCSVKHMAKGKGASASSHAQYISREGRYSRLNAGQSHDGTPPKEDRALAKSDYLTREGRHARRSDLETVFHGNMPKWAQENPREFWQAADTYERKNGRVYTEIVVALPRELSPKQREDLVREFAANQLGERFPYTVSIHNPKAMDGKEQPHAHVMFSNREHDGIERPKEVFFKRANSQRPELGGAKKSREWSFDSRSNDMLGGIRKAWEGAANKALERAGIDERIDRRSNAARGIEVEPEPKMGPGVTQRVKRGLETEKGAKVIELRAYREEQRKLQELEQELEQEKAKVYEFDFKRGGAEANEFSFVGEKREVPEEERKRYRRTVDLVLTRYEREDKTTEYRWKKSGKVAFVDRGDRITFNSITPTAVKAGLQVAKEKGWEGVKVTGSKEFRRESWFQAELMGIELKGYRATKEDQRKLVELKKEQELKKEKYRESKVREGLGSREKKEVEKPVLERKKERIGEFRVKVTEVIKDINRQIEDVREKGGEGVERRVDELYRDKYALKNLGNEQVLVREKDGRFDLVERSKIEKQAKDILRSKQQERDRGRGR